MENILKLEIHRTKNLKREGRISCIKFSDLYNILDGQHHFAFRGQLMIWLNLLPSRYKVSAERKESKDTKPKQLHNQSSPRIKMSKRFVWDFQRFVKWWLPSINWCNNLVLIMVIKLGSDGVTKIRF